MFVLFWYNVPVFEAPFVTNPSVNEKEKRVSYKYRPKINATGTGSSKFFDRVELTFACTASHVNVNPEYH